MSSRSIPGYELAVAAALDGRLRAAVVPTARRRPRCSTALAPTAAGL